MVCREESRTRGRKSVAPKSSSGYLHPLDFEGNLYYTIWTEQWEQRTWSHVAQLRVFFPQTLNLCSWKPAQTTAPTSSNIHQISSFLVIIILTPSVKTNPPFLCKNEMKFDVRWTEAESDCRSEVWLPSDVLSLLCGCYYLAFRPSAFTAADTPWNCAALNASSAFTTTVKIWLQQQTARRKSSRQPLNRDTKPLPLCVCVCVGEAECIMPPDKGNKIVELLLWGNFSKIQESEDSLSGL